MNLATFRVVGGDQELADLLKSFPRDADAKWEKGQLTRPGRTHAVSGFRATIADTSNPSELVLAVRQFLDECQAKGLAFSDGTLSSELSIGVAVGDAVQFVAFVDFGAEDLSLMGALGINLSLAAYPTSNEANAADQPEILQSKP